MIGCESEFYSFSVKLILAPAPLHLTMTFNFFSHSSLSCKPLFCTSMLVSVFNIETLMS